MSSEEYQIENWLRSLPSTRVLVIGDLILDRYIWGSVDRISPEAPIQVLESEREELRLGGAANVAQNLLALDAEVRCLSVVGTDGAGDQIIGRLRKRGANLEGVLRNEDRNTPLKTRMLAQQQQVLRLDREDTYDITGDLEGDLLEHLRNQLDWAQVALFCDYRKGILTADLLHKGLSLCRNHGVKTIIDPKGEDYERYRGTYAIAPNRKETEQATGIELKEESDYREAASILQEKLACELVIVTRGPEGISLFENQDLEVHVPAEAIEVFDVTGAGDTVMAVLGLVIGAGEPPLMAVRLANIAGARAVAQLGTAVISREQLLDFYTDRNRRGSGKVLDLPELKEILENERSDGHSIVFTNGCFDLLHRGHIRSLEFAANQGNILVVGVNSDHSVALNKGEERPILPEEDRIELLASIEMVDFVVPFDGETPRDLIEELQPDVLVKGEDWKGRNIVGREVVEEQGGRVAFAPLEQGISTTKIIERIREGGKVPAATDE